MKLFVDSTDINEIKEAVSWGVVDGVTTNPSLVMKSGGCNSTHNKSKPWCLVRVYGATAAACCYLTNRATYMAQLPLQQLAAVACKQRQLQHRYHYVP